MPNQFTMEVKKSTLFQSSQTYQSKKFDAETVITYNKNFRVLTYSIDYESPKSGPSEAT